MITIHQLLILDLCPWHLAFQAKITQALRSDGDVYSCYHYQITC